MYLIESRAEACPAPIRQVVRCKNTLPDSRRHASFSRPADAKISVLRLNFKRLSGNRKLPDHVRVPDALGPCADRFGIQANQDALLATEKGWDLAPGATQELHVLYGIAPRDTENAVIDRYRSGPTNRLPAVMED